MTLSVTLSPESVTWLLVGMGARARKLCLEEDTEGVRWDLSGLEEWFTSGNSERESPWDDDDTVLQRYFEGTSTIGHPMHSRCKSDDP